MSTHRYWRLRVNSVVSANYVGIKWVELIGVLGGANLATHPTTGTATSSSTNNGSSTWAWTASGGWTSAIADPFPQWTQFDFGSATTVVQAKITNTATVAACAQSCVVQSSDNGSSWTDESTFTNSALADGVTSVYFGPAEHGTVALTQPAGVLAALGASCAFVTSPLPALGVYSGAVMALSLPTPEIFFSTGARIELDVPAHTLLALGHNSYGDRAAFLTVPMCTLEITTGANAGVVAPAPTLATTGTVVGISSAALTPTIAALSASGTVSSMAQFDLTAPVQNLIGYGGAVCSITLTGKPTIAVAGTTGGIASVAVTCPLFELTADATAQNYGSANLIAPAPTMGAGGNVAYLVAPGVTLTVIGHAVVTATYEAYAVNLKHQPKPGKEPVDEVTRYTNFPFTHIVRYKNSYFGANSTGLYLLDGTTDYATPTPTAIPWAFKTAMTDFESQQHKTVASAYFGGRLGAAATVDLHVGEDGPQTYSYATVRTDHAQNYRQVFGKGTKARYYALGASGTGTLELDDIDFDVHTLSRRI